MEKLRLDLNGLKVESFEPNAEGGRKGAVLAHDGSDCSQAYTCGIASRGEETYDLMPRTLYACPTCV
ncbi:MAG TPA: hypothetical protein VF541_14285 [Longimicrobium sp.]|jgi:hypothetical protein